MPVRASRKPPRVGSDRTPHDMFTLCPGSVHREIRAAQRVLRPVRNSSPPRRATVLSCAGGDNFSPRRPTQEPDADPVGEPPIQLLCTPGYVGRETYRQRPGTRGVEAASRLVLLLRRQE